MILKLSHGFIAGRQFVPARRSSVPKRVNAIADPSGWAIICACQAVDMVPSGSGLGARWMQLARITSEFGCVGT
jgi:hypothetical protein